MRRGARLTAIDASAAAEEAAVAGPGEAFGARRLHLEERPVYPVRMIPARGVPSFDARPDEVRPGRRPR